jgi:hypothetical protein
VRAVTERRVEALFGRERRRERREEREGHGPTRYGNRLAYGAEVAPGENDILILATTAVIDTMAHPDR